VSTCQLSIGSLVSSCTSFCRGILVIVLYQRNPRKRQSINRLSLITLLTRQKNQKKSPIKSQKHISFSLSSFLRSKSTKIKNSWMFIHIHHEYNFSVNRKINTKPITESQKVRSTPTHLRFLQTTLCFTISTKTTTTNPNSNW